MLELEIKRLSDNIEHLNRLLEAMADTAKQNAQPAAKKVSKPTAKADVPETPTPTPAPTVTPDTTTPSAFTYDSAKALALAIAKKDRTRQPQIKSKLDSFGAKIITELSEDDLQVFGAWITEVKESIGA